MVRSDGPSVSVRLQTGGQIDFFGVPQTRGRKTKSDQTVERKYGMTHSHSFFSLTQINVKCFSFGMLCQSALLVTATSHTYHHCQKVVIKRNFLIVFCCLYKVGLFIG